MKEFSAREKRIIKEKLLKGSMLIDLFSDEFINNARLEISIDTSEEHHVFSYYSDSYDAAMATEELNDVVKLVTYLEENDLVNKYHPPATSMSDFEIIDNMTIGKSESEKRIRFVMPFRSSGPVVLYLYKNLYHTFKATEGLRSLIRNNFKPIQIRQQRTANMIAGGSLLAAVVVTGLSIYQNAAINELGSIVGVNNKRVDLLLEMFNKDSIETISDKEQIQLLTIRLRALELRIKPDSGVIK